MVAVTPVLPSTASDSYALGLCCSSMDSGFFYVMPGEQAKISEQDLTRTKQLIILWPRCQLAVAASRLTAATQVLALVRVLMPLLLFHPLGPEGKKNGSS